MKEDEDENVIHMAPQTPMPRGRQAVQGRQPAQPAQRIATQCADQGPCPFQRVQPDKSCCVGRFRVRGCKDPEAVRAAALDRC